MSVFTVASLASFVARKKLRTHVVRKIPETRIRVCAKASHVAFQAMQDADAGQTGRGWGGGIFNVIDHRKWYPEKKNLDFFTEAPSPLRGGLFFTCPKGTSSTSSPQAGSSPLRGGSPSTRFRAPSSSAGLSGNNVEGIQILTTLNTSNETNG